VIKPRFARAIVPIVLIAAIPQAECNRIAPKAKAAGTAPPETTPAAIKAITANETRATFAADILILQVGVSVTGSFDENEKLRPDDVVAEFLLPDCLKEPFSDKL
jgi:hypothetical protein